MKRGNNGYPPPLSLEEAIDLLEKFDLKNIPDHLFRLMASIIKRDRRTINQACNLIKIKFGPENLILIIKTVRAKLKECEKNTSWRNNL